ncbi:MAG TPA: YafY family protein [Usitatibacter sp.]|jgi:predicted DNA-binding transcriptional regulator YafY|nr:YafY family protein [Usitatibacter sp.]
MRAGRLLTVLMLLQANRRMTAARLAAELRVSLRTIHRDIAELSASGVPVVTHRGAAGGFSLLEGWRTRLTGLTADEAQAMLLAGAPAAASDLGLGDSAASARVKLLAALPAEWHEHAGRVGARFHLDPIGWYRSGERSGFLMPVARAVWDGKRIRIRYESWKGVVERRIDPLGLVMKAGEWYLVGSADKSPRTYKISNILSLERLDESFQRKRSFDLARYWAASLERFEAGLYQASARIRLSPAGRKAMRHGSAAVAKAVEDSASAPDGTGWTTHRIPIESVDHAASELLRLAGECEVLAPRELRLRMAQSTHALARLYAPSR